MAARIDPLSRVVGKLEQAVLNLESTVTKMVENWQQQDAAANAGRKELHAKVDGLCLDVQGLASEVKTVRLDVNNLQDNFKAVASTVSEHEALRNQGAGARKVLLLGWKAGVAIGGGIIALIGITVGAIVQLKPDLLSH